MNEQEQREAIAKAAGWKKWQDEESGILGGDWSKFIWTPPGNHTLGDAKDEPPDYLNDLNAMHEAEKVIYEPNTLGRNKHRRWVWNQYCEALARITGDTECVHVAAAQKAEAFLRTLGLWKESA